MCELQAWCLALEVLGQLFWPILLFVLVSSFSVDIIVELQNGWARSLGCIGAVLAELV